MLVYLHQAQGAWLGGQVQQMALRQRLRLPRSGGACSACDGAPASSAEADAPEVSGGTGDEEDSTATARGEVSGAAKRRGDGGNGAGRRAGERY